MHQYRSFPPCSNAIFAHCINQTNETSGFDPVAFFKMSLRCNQWSKSNKIHSNWYWPPHIYYVWKLETNNEKLIVKNLCRKKIPITFSQGCTFLHGLQNNVNQDKTTAHSHYDVHINRSQRMPCFVIADTRGFSNGELEWVTWGQCS